MHESRLRVRYAECDMQVHVFNSHYLTWFDIAHTEALRATAGSYQSIVERGFGLVVAEANVRYRRRPASTTIWWSAPSSSRSARRR